MNQSWPPAVSPESRIAEDVGVQQPGGHPDLALEPVGADGGGELGVEHLERDLAAIPQVGHQHDARHSAPAELAAERVAVGQVGLELGAELGLHLSILAPEAVVGVKENFCPPTDASYISPPFAMVTIATPLR